MKEAEGEGGKEEGRRRAGDGGEGLVTVGVGDL